MKVSFYRDRRMKNFYFRARHAPSSWPGLHRIQRQPIDVYFNFRSKPHSDTLFLLIVG